jgi:hypothetical protein
MSSDRGSRKRRSSSIVYHEPPESIEQLSDQSALPNLNAEWVNAKGTASTATYCSEEGIFSHQRIVEEHALQYRTSQLTEYSPPIPRIVSFHYTLNLS